MTKAIHDQFDSEPEDDLGPAPLPQITARRAIPVVLVLTVLVLLALLPPLLNVNRYKRQIVTSISTSLGRPVHIDSVSLNLLPLPSFTLTHFIISEDPHFGAEPVLLANEVRATLRVSSLWRRRVEFSTIALDTPSVNLVHLADGRWNLESILLQASRMPAAPTAQRAPGSAQRFPYIEATNARVNLKMGLEKMPLSFTDTEFALWLPEPNEWHIRLKAHPARTDAPSTDSGILRIEGTLGHAATLYAVPIDLHGDWRAAPLGAVSWIFMGHDAGLRGEMNLYGNLRGTVGQSDLATHLSLQRVRRAEFVPEQTLDAEIACKAQLAEVFHAIHQVHCAWPSASEEESKDTAQKGLTLTGDLPDIRHPEVAQVSGSLTNIPAAALLDVLRVSSHRVSPDLKADGLLSGRFAFDPAILPVPVSSPKTREKADSSPSTATFTIIKARLALGEERPFFEQDVTATITGGQMFVSPIAMALGAQSATAVGNPAGTKISSLPATDSAIFDARADLTGYTLHLAGSVLPVRLLQLAQALPEFGDGIETFLPALSVASVATASPQASAPLLHPTFLTHIDLVSTRKWPTRQMWTPAPPSRSAAHQKSK